MKCTNALLTCILWKIWNASRICVSSLRRERVYMAGSRTFAHARTYRNWVKGNFPENQKIDDVIKKSGNRWRHQKIRKSGSRTFAHARTYENQWRHQKIRKSGKSENRWRHQKIRESMTSSENRVLGHAHAQEYRKWVKGNFHGIPKVSKGNFPWNRCWLGSKNV